MKALVLAAGFGVRLRPLTNKTPKPLLPVFGIPLINHIIEYLKLYGIENIVINNHYLGHQIMEHLGDGSRFGIRVTHSTEETILGSGGAVGRAAGFLGGERFFLLHNADILTDINLSGVIAGHRSSGNGVTMVLIDREKYNQVEVDLDGRIIDIRRKGQGNEEGNTGCLAYTGISVISTDLLPEFHGDREEDLIRIFLELIRKGIRVGYHFVKECFWDDIGSLSSYLMLHKLLHNKGHASYISPLAEVADSAALKGFYSVGDYAVIGEKCFIENLIF